jgi:hypothetical protein
VSKDGLQVFSKNSKINIHKAHLKTQEKREATSLKLLSLKTYFCRPEMAALLQNHLGGEDEV